MRSTWPGIALLTQADGGADLALEASEAKSVDWNAFSDSVHDFQYGWGDTELDVSLGKNPLRAMVRNQAFAPPDLSNLRGDTVGRIRSMRVVES